MTIKRRYNKNHKKTKRKLSKKMKGGTLKSVIAINETNKIEKINFINNKNIYKINVNNCNHYFIEKKYVVFNENDQYYIYNLTNDGGNIDNIIIKNVENILNSNSQPFMKRHKLYKHDVMIIDRDCVQPIDLSYAKDYLNDLNNVLKTKCPNLELEFDYMYNLNCRKINSSIGIQNLILCLNNNEGCISFIVLNINEKDRSVEISSNTDKIYENKKYNKLLRAVIIMLVYCLNIDMDYIISNAVNPISAYLLVKYFKAIIPNNETNESFYNFIKKNDIELNEETDYKKVFNMFNQNEEFILSVYVPNKTEIVNYIMEQYTNIIDEIIC